MDSEQRLRENLAAVLKREPVDFDDLSKERVARAVQAQGPALVRKEAPRSRWRLVPWAVAAAVAAVALLLVRPHKEVATEISDTRACAHRPSSNGPSLRPQSQGALTFEFGTTAIAQATAGSVVDVVTATPCTITLNLARGDLSVHARDLGGGELNILTPHGTVQVRGTVFSVHADERDFQVDVVEGKVFVQRPAKNGRAFAPVYVAKEQSSRTSVDGFTLSALGEGRSDLIRAAVGLAATTAPTIEPAAEPEAALPLRHSLKRPATVVHVQAKLQTVEREPMSLRKRLVEAEALRRKGDVNAARLVYREVGLGKGPTAEAAWLALAKLELDVDNVTAAKAALSQHEARFARGLLGAEAMWIGLRADRLRGDSAAVRNSAARLIKRWPDTPQARAAHAFLSPNSGEK